MDKKCPQRVRLRNVLDAVYAVEDSGKKLDLQALGGLVGLLVEANQRHTKHSNGAFNPPVLGKDACARGSRGCVYCRYGFPKEKFPRGGDR